MTMMMRVLAAASTVAAVTVCAAISASAQTMPTIDSDAHLATASVGDGSLHGVLDLSLQNGDFSRGAYDDDAANLHRLPAAAALTLGVDLHHDATGATDLWLEAASSNGFHSPIALEQTSPRAWYESNNLVALAYKPDKSVTAVIAYVVKTSPNGASPTTNEVSGAIGYQTDTGIGWLRPSVAVSAHAKGGTGVYTLFSIEPTIDLTADTNGPTLAIPARFGIGWGGFYKPGTGTATYGSVGLAYAYPFKLGSAHLKLHAQMLALIRDDTVRNIVEADSERSRVVPLGTLGFSVSL